MTTPNTEWTDFIQAYSLSPLSAGFQFAHAQGSKLTRTNEIPLPIGVSTVQVTYSGESSVITDVRFTNGKKLRPAVLQFEAGQGTRMGVVDIPVPIAGTNLTFTLQNAPASDVGLPIFGVKVMTVPLAP
ncbi:hypothetical protein KBX29_03780 [Corynebacterium sp. CCUG 18816]|uniref:hypothetical protein n=1 Tax=Corynebacterium pseudogenitalium TaxID=38303 RepID=UPI00210CEA54|nr:hypothetical protein [Corynebacterium pseudogenitalium]MCQ4615968.1 hypothetical protein [Corynebacterium pseudogenitalium]